MSELNNRTPHTMVLFHRDADGFASAVAFWAGNREGRVTQDVIYQSIQYGEPVPEIPDSVDALVILDFSFDAATMMALATKFTDKPEGLLVAIDHHATSKQTFEGLKDEFPRLYGYIIHNTEKAACQLAWDFFNADPSYTPDIFRYVADRDIWKWALPKSEEVNLFISTLPQEPTEENFALWRGFLAEDGIKHGQVLKAFRDQQIRGALREVRQFEFLGHENVAIVNACTNISEVGHAVLEKFPDAPFAVMYMDRANGIRTFSLRSRGDVDVSEIAKEQGGGGHPAAAGFSVRYEPTKEEMEASDDQ